VCVSIRGAMSKVPPKPDIPPPQDSIKPGNDFYKYVNGNWIRHASMPPYLSSYGVSEEIEEQINKELMSILDSARSEVRNYSDKNIPHTDYLLGTLTESALNAQNQMNNVKFIRGMVGNMKCIRDQNDVASTLGDFIKHRIPTMLSFMVIPMETKSSIYRLALAHGDLGLPDIHYYFSKSSSHRRTLVAYGKLLTHLSKDFDVEGLERIVGLEHISATEIIKGRKDNEILINGSDIEEKYKAVPWHVLFHSALGWTHSEFRNAKILVLSTRWLAYLNRCFKTFTLDTWKTLFSAQLLLHVLPILPPPFDDMEFELFGHRLRGQSEKVPQRRLVLRLAQEWLSASLGSAFIKKFVPEIIKRSAFNMANEIKAMAKHRAEATEWLNINTRKRAGKKVNSIILSVAYPSVIIKDKKTVLHPDNLVRNVLDLANMEFKDEIAKMNTQLNPANWEDAVFAVNAYYYNEGNRLILPSGILRWPFFHIEASDGWNFGGLGATIGHEICHAFDADGKDYDETGNKKSWWSKEETENYLVKTKALIKLFNGTTYFGQHLNGELTLSENIADLGGVGISLEALKLRLDKKKITGMARKKQLCDFFMSFAVSWRTKEKKEKALQSLFMDVHAPPVARVNNIVSQFDDWYECFDIKPENALYKEPSDRIRIF